MRNIILALVLAMTASFAWGQKETPPEGGAPTGTITDGAVSFAYNGIGAGGAANADFLGTGPGGDQVFSLWWYYRISGDTQETPFPPPDTENYAGNTATLTWADVDGRGFAAQLINVVADVGGPSGTLTSSLTLTNNTGGALTIDLFWYVDGDIAGSAGGDSAVLTTSPTLITVSDGAETLEMLGGGNDAFQVLAWPGIRDLLSDAALDNLNNSGLPFGPGDFTAAMQWSSVVINNAAAMNFGANLGANTAAPPIMGGGPGGPPGEPVQVPTLNTMGLALLALVLALLTFVVLRRRA